MSMQNDALAVLAGHPTKLRFGAGIAAQCASEWPEGERVLVVASAGTRQRAQALFDALARHGGLAFAEAVPAESSLEAVSACIEAARGRSYSRVLAVGGGTVMDTAKALAICVPGDAPFATVLRQPDSFAGAALPLVCVPTTSGTGSEVTRWATIWDLAAGRKRSLSHAAVVPRCAWLDPTLMFTLPASVTATSGLDALAHAMESLWGRHHTPRSDALALAAAREIAACLPRALQAPHDLPARAGMARAALAAGLAISLTETAAAHAASYPLTLGYGIAHGHACALSLPWLLRWHAIVRPERVAPLIAALGAPHAEAAAAFVVALMQTGGLASRLRDLGVPRSALPALVETTIASERMHNTIGELTPERVHEMFESAW